MTFIGAASTTALVVDASGATGVTDAVALGAGSLDGAGFGFEQPKNAAMKHAAMNVARDMGTP
jgi:hypothetical protein